MRKRTAMKAAREGDGGMTRTQAIQQARGPIAFTRENAEKSISERKWQTRRVITPRDRIHGMVPNDGTDDNPIPVGWPMWEDEFGDWHPQAAPWKPGDIAYIPEPAKIVRIEHDLHLVDFEPPQCSVEYQWFRNPEEPTQPRLRDLSINDYHKLLSRKRGIYAPTTARFMLKSFARHFIRIKAVRVERLQDISDADARAEGCNPAPWDLTAPNTIHTSPAFRDVPTGDKKLPWAYHRATFSRLWESIHGEGAWERNPWLWVIEYEPLEVKG